MKKLNLLARSCSLFLLLSFSNFLVAQSVLPADLALRYIETNIDSWGLTKVDVDELSIADQYTSNHNGVTHIYYIQKYQGIEVDLAIINLAVTTDGKVYHIGHRLINNLESKINATTASISAQQAVQAAMSNMELEITSPLRVVKEKEHYFEYEKGSNLFKNTSAKLQYKLDTQDKLRLSWQIILSPKESVETWLLNVDANTGEVFYKKDKTIKCNFSKDNFHTHNESCHANANLHKQDDAANTTITMGGTYNVFPFPLESPSFGNRMLVTDPADPIASPFGWHDTNGVEGAESNFTEGNNIVAFNDRNNSFTPAGNLPDGGVNLEFDFPYNPDLEPITYSDASTTNLFYVTNVIHDVTYRYGFDEAAGNFQNTNYTNEGIGNDRIFARSQAGANIFNQDNSNNASFNPSVEGDPGIINMYEWGRSAASASLLTVVEPSDVAGNYETGSANFGNEITEVAIEGNVVLIDDEVTNPAITDACEAIANTEEVDGNIALIDRGECDFSAKVFRAQEAGAIAVIICNNRGGGIVGMDGGQNANQVNIPSVFISQEDCFQLRTYAGTSLTVSLQSPPVTGPDRIDGDFDNGIIAHEYMHGISERFNCSSQFLGSLTEGESMGEGWSDFISLALTVREGDTPEQRRGIGTYVSREPIDGKGIRTFPYSTDMTINPHTYRDLVVDDETHFVGSLWTAMLWDLYWAFVEQDGWSADLINGNSGNNIAIQLIFDGMKLMPCNPGFVDGRDAILLADEINNNGENQCLIWKTFARRGLGHGAEQGTVFLTNDGTASFDEFPLCIKELKVTKSGPDFIQAGDDINYEIKVVNHKDQAVNNVVITDEIPVGASYMDGTASNDASINDDNIVWTIDQLAANDSITVSYTVNTSIANKSAQIFLDDVPTELSDEFWVQEIIENTNFFNIQDVIANSGDFAWFVENEATLSKQHLASFVPLTVPANNPVFRFFHRYRTETGLDGGTIEISTDEENWVNAEPFILKGKYDGKILSNAIGFERPGAFSGNSQGFIPTVIDMSNYANQQVYFRFRFGTNFQNSDFGTFQGWFLDDFEFFEMFNYDGEVVVTTDEQDEVRARIDGRGTIVESEIVSDINDPITSSIQLNVFPNPAKNQVNIGINSKHNENLQINIVTTDGRQVIQKEVDIYSGSQTFPIDISSLAAGIYFIKLGTDSERVIKKIIVN